MESKVRIWWEYNKIMSLSLDMRNLPDDQMEQEVHCLMQFTGLWDKNGKEIYEGDILRKYEYNEKWDDGAIGEVQWSAPKFTFNWKILLAKSGEKEFRDPISTICSSEGYSSENIEVIGNKFDNPELLTPKSKSTEEKE